jgi:hypothetical protein
MWIDPSAIGHLVVSRMAELSSRRRKQMRFHFRFPTCAIAGGAQFQITSCARDEYCGTPSLFLLKREGVAFENERPPVGIILPKNMRIAPCI